MDLHRRQLGLEPRRHDRVHVHPRHRQHRQIHQAAGHIHRRRRQRRVPHQHCHGQTSAPSGAIQSLAAGNDHPCAIADEDTITCWGDNRDGQANAPTGTFQSISLGDDHSCAVTADAEVACWGDNEYGKSGTAEGALRSVSRRRQSHLRHRHRPVHRMLGIQQVWPIQPARRYV